MKALTYKGRTFALKDYLYRVKIDDPPREIRDEETGELKIKCPPQVNPMFGANDTTGKPGGYGTVRTDMSQNEWDLYLKWLNGDKFYAAVGRNFCLFNSPQDWDDGGTMMESLVFGQNWVLAEQTLWWPWYRIFTLNWEDGPPDRYVTYKENPLFVQKLTYICSISGNTYARRLYYPMVCKRPVFMDYRFLEKWSPKMKTPPPALGVEELMNMDIHFS